MNNYKFDIAFSLLHKDLPYAQPIYDELSQDNLKTFLYQHNQKELENSNGISVFSDLYPFKQDFASLVHDF